MTRPAITIRRPQRPGRPPRPTTRPTALPQGPRWLAKLENRKGRVATGPGQPPRGFVTATTSAEEWIVYWALAKVFNDPPDPREPPYWGGYNWGYQIAEQGGRQSAGGAVVDYVVYTLTDVIGLRLQTDHFHLNASNAIQSYDARQKINLARSGGMIVVDLFSQDLIEDPTGSAAIQVVKDAIGLMGRIDPLLTGLARRTRIGKLI